MIEVVVKVTATDLCKSIDNLACAIAGKDFELGFRAEPPRAKAPQAPVAQVNATPAGVAAPMAPMPAVPTPAAPMAPMPAVPTPAAPVAPTAIVPPIVPQAPSIPAPTMGQAMTTPATVAVNQGPATAPSGFTIEQLSTAAAELTTAHREVIPQIQNVFTRYGIHSMTELRPELYPAFAQDLRTLGAKI